MTDQEVSGSDALPAKIRIYPPQSDGALADEYAVSSTTTLAVVKT